jgi:hypothetical protein
VHSGVAIGAKSTGNRWKITGTNANGDERRTLSVGIADAESGTRYSYITLPHSWGDGVGKPLSTPQTSQGSDSLQDPASQSTIRGSTFVTSSWLQSECRESWC